MSTVRQSLSPRATGTLELIFSFLVEFRMIVFRPFKGEIITGTVQNCTPAGIQSQDLPQLYQASLTDLYTSYHAILRRHICSPDDAFRGMRIVRHHARIHRFRGP